MRFADVIGQHQLKSKLVKGVDEGRVSHTQLFAGRSGCGTLALAVAYAQYVNCTDRRDGDSCGVCASCLKTSQLVHPDLHFVFPMNTPKTNNSPKPTCDIYLPQWREIVTRTNGYFSEQIWYRAINIENQQGLISANDANEVLRKLSFKAFESKYKVVIMWLPERMSDKASNALLKILEEPWDDTLFLLVSEAPTALLPTIISRTQEVAVAGVEVADIERFLAEKYGLQGDKLHSIARLAGGDMIEAQRLAAGDEDGAREEFFELFKGLMRLSYNDRHMELLEWAENAAALDGREARKRFLQYSLRMLRENYMLNAGMDGITYLWGEELAFSRNFAPFIGNHNIEALVAEMESALAQIAQNGNPKIIFSHFALAVSKLIVRK